MKYYLHKRFLRLYFFTFFVFFIVCDGHLKEEGFVNENNSGLNDWVFPIDDSSLMVINRSLQRLDCGLAEYLAMWGLSVTESDVYIMDKDTNRLRASCSIENSKILLHFLSQLTKASNNGSKELKELIEVYSFEKK